MEQTHCVVGPESDRMLDTLRHLVARRKIAVPNLTGIRCQRAGPYGQAHHQRCIGGSMDYQVTG